MLEKLTRLLKLKQKLSLDPSSYDYFEMDRFSVSRIEVIELYSATDKLIITVISNTNWDREDYNSGSRCNRKSNFKKGRVRRGRLI